MAAWHRGGGKISKGGRNFNLGDSRTESSARQNGKCLIPSSIARPPFQGNSWNKNRLAEEEGKRNPETGVIRWARVIQEGRITCQDELPNSAWARKKNWERFPLYTNPNRERHRSNGKENGILLRGSHHRGQEPLRERGRGGRSPSLNLSLCLSTPQGRERCQR